MMLLCGTVPDRDFPLTCGQVSREGEVLSVEGRRFSRTQGTGAMISAAVAVTTHLGLEPSFVLVAGDIGEGKGTRDLFQYLIENVGSLAPTVLTLHYCLPIMGLMGRLCEAVRGTLRRPVMIADAGAMYAAKGGGFSREFDVFTPDPSEVAFLADPEAHHPAYISHHLLADGAETVPEQIAAAFRLQAAAKVLVAKGKTDYVADENGVVAVIDEPDVPALECIGGTGDTITGLVSAFCSAALEPVRAGIVACRANRLAGQLAHPTPATRAGQIVDQLPAVLSIHYARWCAGGN